LENFSQKSEVTLSMCAAKPTGGLMLRMEKFVVCEISRLVSNCNNTRCAVSKTILIEYEKRNLHAHIGDE